MLKLYSRTEDRALVLEIWGASTKHPDLTFTLTREERLQEMCFQHRWTQDVKFLFTVAGKMLWVSTAIEIADLARTMYKQCITIEYAKEGRTLTDEDLASEWA